MKAATTLEPKTLTALCMIIVPIAGDRIIERHRYTDGKHFANTDKIQIIISGGGPQNIKFIKHVKETEYGSHAL